MIEVALWCAILYIAVGVVWTFFHPDLVRQIESQVQNSLPAGADLLAFGATTVLWPALLFASDVSPQCQTGLSTGMRFSTE